MGCRDDNLSFFIDFPFLLLAAQLPDISNARLVEKLRPGVDTKARRVKKAGKARVNVAVFAFWGVMLKIAGIY